MDEAKLQEIEARANAATPGPWYAGNGHPYVTTERMGFGIVVARALEGNDCTFIAHVRTDVPDLLAEVRRLTAALATARREGAEAQIAGAVAVRDAVMGYLDEIFPGGPAATDARWPHELMEHVACAVARVKRSVGGAT